MFRGSARNRLSPKILIHAEDGTYEGIVHSIDLNHKRITLNKVVSHASGKSMTGLLHFFGNDIDKIELLEEQPINRKTVSQNERGPTILKKKNVPEHLKRLRNVDRSNLLLKDKHKRSTGYSSLSSGEEEFANYSRTSSSTDVPNPPVDKSCVLPETQNGGRTTQASGHQDQEELPANQNHQDSPANQNHRETPANQNQGETPANQNHIANVTLLEAMDESFDRALHDIKSMQKIGLAMEGINLGRDGTLCWVQVGCPKHTFLFDIINLGKEAVTKGLKPILENGSIQKVIHDCRRISDLLYNQYNIRLVNVFDTQVAAVMVYRIRHGGDFPKYVRGLHICLFEHLDLPEEEVFIHRVREENIKGDESVWAERPASVSMIDAAVKNVVHLGRLSNVMHNKMLTDFTDGVDIYLSIYRDAKTDHIGPAAAVVGKTHLPEEFHCLRSCAEEKRSRFLRLHHAENEYDEKGFRISCSKIHDPAIKFTHDGILHAGPGFPARRADSPEQLVRRGRARSSSSGRRSRSKSVESKETVLDLGGAKERRRQRGSDTEGSGVASYKGESFDELLKKQAKTQAKQAAAEKSGSSKGSESDTVKDKDRSFVPIAAGSESSVCLAKLPQREIQKGTDDCKYKQDVDLEMIPSRQKKPAKGSLPTNTSSGASSSEEVKVTGLVSGRGPPNDVWGVTPSDSESDSPGRTGVGRGRAKQLHSLLKELSVGRKTSPTQPSPDQDRKREGQPNGVNGSKQDVTPPKGAGRAAILEYMTNKKDGMC